MAGQGQPKTGSEAPVEALQDLLKVCSEVDVKVDRQNHKGHWAYVIKARKAVSELVDLQPWLDSVAGGGRYRVEVYDIHDPMKRPLTPWFVEVEGPSRQVVRNRGAAHVGPGEPGPASTVTAVTTPDGNVMQIPSDPMIAFQMGQQMMRGAGPSGRFASSGGRFQSDAIAMRQVEKYEAQLEEERKERERERREFERRMAALTEQANKIKEDAAAERQRLEIHMLEKRIEMMSNGSNGKQQSADWSGILGAAVPLLVAMVQTSSERQREQSTTQLKSMDLQMQGINNLMTATLTKDSGGDLSKIIAVIPALVPLFTQWMEDRSPTKAAELMAVMGDNQLTNLSMVQGFIETFAQQQPETPPWFPVVQEALQGLINVTEQVMRPEPRKSGSALATTAPGPVKISSEATTPEKIVDEVMPQLNPKFHTQEWATIIFHIHSQQDANLEALGDMIASHLDNQTRAGTLPPSLTGVMQDPREVFGAFLERLPIANLNPEFARKLLNQVQRAMSPSVVDMPTDEEESVEFSTQETQPS